MGLTIREIKEGDFKVINELNQLQGDFKISDLNNIIIDRIVLDGNVVVAYGIVKKFAEAILLVNPIVNKMLRAQAMRELMIYAMSATSAEGITQLHTFVHDAKLARLLERQYDFQQTHDIVLVKNL
jgi:hypothetical protein